MNEETKKEIERNPIVKGKHLGTWIPSKIWRAKDLTWMEKATWAQVFCLQSLNGCFATNAYLGRKMNVEANTMAKNLCVLRKKGYIKNLSSKKGNGRILLAVIPSSKSLNDKG